MFWGKSRNIVVALEVGSTKVVAAVGEIRPDGTLALLDSGRPFQRLGIGLNEVQRDVVVVTEGGALSIAFAAQHPRRVESLILYGSYPRKVATADYPWGVSPQTVAQFIKRFDEAWASGAWWDIVNPHLPLDPDTQRWWARYLRVGASPGMARDLMLMNAQLESETGTPPADQLEAVERMLRHGFV